MFFRNQLILFTGFLFIFAPTFGDVLKTEGFENKTAVVQLFKPAGDDYEAFGSVEVRGAIVFNDDGDILKGANAFLRMQTPENPGRWFAIAKRKLINGRLIATLENGKSYTIYELESGFLASVVEGRNPNRPKQVVPKHKGKFDGD